MSRLPARSATFRARWLGRRAALALVALSLAACAKERPPMNPDPAQNTYAPALDVALERFAKRPSGLYVRDDKVGTGALAEAGRTVDVHYTGWLTDGTQFDSSRDGDPPISFGLGRGEVIQGWDEGLQGMRVGGQRTLVIPAQLGYGTRGAGGDIPPNSVLVFKVELMNVR